MIRNYFGLDFDGRVVIGGNIRLCFGDKHVLHSLVKNCHGLIVYTGRCQSARSELS